MGTQIRNFISMPNNVSNGVTVIICCFNSTGRITETLKALACQTGLNNVDWEVVLVDNGSTDKTGEASKEAWHRFGGPATLRIVKEVTPGLSYARQRGIAESNFDLCIFCDDDNWLAADYLSTAKHIVDSNALIGACGGIGYATSDSTLPPWFLDFQSSYAVGPQSNMPGYVNSLYGAGLTFRKAIAQSAIDKGFRSLLVDRTGGVLSSGGDTEFCEWVKIQGYKCWYDERLKFKHFLQSDRLTECHLAGLIKSFGASAPIIALYRDSWRHRTWSRQLACATIGYLRHGLFNGRRDKRLHARIRNKAWAGALLRSNTQFQRAKISIRKMKECFSITHGLSDTNHLNDRSSPNI